MPRRPNHILTDREQRFVDEFLVDLNKTQAAIRAGYSARTARQGAEQVSKRPRVAAAIEWAIMERAERLQVDQDHVVQALAAVAFGDPRTLFDDTGALLPMDKLPDAAAALVASLEIVATVKDGDAQPGNKPGGRVEYVIKLRTADRIKALELLGRHVGLFQERAESSDGDGQPPAITVTFVRPDDGRGGTDAPNATPLDDLR